MVPSGETSKSMETSGSLVKSVAPAEFATWAQSARGSGPLLDQANYATLSRQSERVAPFVYGGVDPQLFHAIAMQKIPPSPGPEPEKPGHAGREVSVAGR